MNIELLSQSALFHDFSEDAIHSMLSCLQPVIKNYEKDQFVFRAGDTTDCLGLVLGGTVHIRQDDIWGRQHIFDQVIPGEVFGESYACSHHERLMVDAAASESCQVLLLNIDRILTVCPNACAFHQQLIRRLLSILAEKNLNLIRKMQSITPKSIRERLLSFFSYQALRNKSNQFEISFNRQQLADYLCVDRSALSAELGRMQREGYLTFHRNHFTLTENSLPQWQLNKTRSTYQ